MCPVEAIVVDACDVNTTSWDMRYTMIYNVTLWLWLA